MPVGVSFIVFREADTRLRQLRTVPCVDEIERETPAADVFDLQRHLREHDRMVEIGLDRRDDLDAIGQRRDCRRRCPRFELIELFVVGIDGVLSDQRGIEAEPFCFQNQVTIAGPGSIVGFGGILKRGATAVYERPDAETG